MLTNFLQFGGVLGKGPGEVDSLNRLNRTENALRFLMLRPGCSGEHQDTRRHDVVLTCNAAHFTHTIFVRPMQCIVRVALAKLRIEDNGLQGIAEPRLERSSNILRHQSVLDTLSKSQQIPAVCSSASLEKAFIGLLHCCKIMEHCSSSS